MRIGQLRHRVGIQEYKETGRDKYNDPFYEWVRFATVWAAIEPLRGEEFFASRQIQAETTHKVTIRYLPGMTTRHRIKFGERILEIESILNPEERNISLELLCKEKV